MATLLCHNPKCRKLFEPWRYDQKHCNADCGRLCSPCNHQSNIKMARLREATERTVAGAWKWRLRNGSIVPDPKAR